MAGLIASEETGRIDWSKGKKAGISYAVLRAGYGTGTIDLLFREHAAGCSREGIPFGVYWRSYAYTPDMAEAEAVCCIETIEEFQLALPVWMEYGKDAVRYAASRGVTVTGSLSAQMRDRFCGRMERAGYRAVYCENIQNFLRISDTLP